MTTTIIDIRHLPVMFQVETAIKNFQVYFKTLEYEEFATQVQMNLKLSHSAWDELLNRYENK